MNDDINIGIDIESNIEEQERKAKSLESALRRLEDVASEINLFDDGTAQRIRNYEQKISGITRAMKDLKNASGQVPANKKGKWRELSRELQKYQSLLKEAKSLETTTEKQRRRNNKAIAETAKELAGVSSELERLQGKNKRPVDIRVEANREQVDDLAESLSNVENEAERAVKATSNLSGTIKALATSFVGISKGIDKFSLNVAKTFGIGGVLATGMNAFNKITSNVRAGIDRFDIQNNFQAVLNNLGVSSLDSRVSVDRLAEGLRGLPTALDTGMGFVQKLLGWTGDIELATEGFLAMNNAIIAGGQPVLRQTQGLSQLINMMMSGEPVAARWSTLNEVMPAQLAQIAREMGMLNTEDLRVQLQQGTASFEDMLEVMIRLNRDGADGVVNFDRQARDASAGVSTSITNMNISIQRGIASILSSLELATGSFGGLNGMIGNFGRVIERIMARVASVIEMDGHRIASAFNDVLSALERMDWEGLTAGFITGMELFLRVSSNVGKVIADITNLLGPMGIGAVLVGSKVGNMAISFLKFADNMKIIDLKKFFNELLPVKKTVLKTSESFSVASRMSGFFEKSLVSLGKVVKGVKLLFSAKGLPFLVGGLLVGAFVKLTSQLQANSDVMSHHRHVIEEYTQAFDNLRTSTERSLGALQQQLDEVNFNLNPEIISQYIDRIVELAENSERSALQTELLERALNHLRTATGENIQIFDEFGNPLENIRELLEGTASATLEVVSRSVYVQKAAEAYEALYNIQRKVASSSIELAEMLDDLGRNEWAEQIRNGNGTLEELRYWFDQNRVAIADTHPELFNFVNNIVSNGVAVERYTEILEDAEYALESFGEQAKETSDEVAYMADVVTNAYRELDITAIPVTERLSRGHHEAFSSMVENMEWYVGRAGEFLDNFIHNAEEQMRINALMERSQEELGDAHGVFVRIVEEMSRKYGQINSDQLKELLNNQEFRERIMEADVKLYQSQSEQIIDAMDIADDMGEMATEGWESFDAEFTRGGKASEEVVSTVVQRVVDTAKDGFGTNSPSTVFHQIGVDVIQGLINGIRSLQGQLIGLMSSIASDVSSRASAINSTINSTRANNARGFANGGVVYRAGGGSIFKPRGTDIVPAMLTPGEYVTRKQAVAHFGQAFMNKVNNLDVQGAYRDLTAKLNGVGGSRTYNKVSHTNQTINDYKTINIHTNNLDANKLKTDLGRHSYL